jgi:5-hydroxyisourate hydrolase
MNRRIALAEVPGQPQLASVPSARPTISTHVLDTERGAPAEGVRVALYRLDVGAAPIRMTQVLTDSDGRVRDLLERPLTAGEYRLEFDLVGGEDDEDPFFTRLAVDLSITDVGRSYHVPLLLAPYSMTTYRGS